MQVVFVNGRTTSADWRELQEALSHPATIALFLIGILSFRLLPFANDVPHLQPRAEALFWAHVLILYMAIYLGVAAWCERAGRTLWTWALQGLIAGTLTTTGTFFFRTAGVPATDGTTLFLFWLFLWALLLFFELIFVTFLLDLVRKTRAVESDTATRSPMRVVFVTGRRMSLRFREVYRVLLHPATVGLTLLVVGVMAVQHPYPVIRSLPVEVATKFWAHVLVVFYLSFLALAWFCRCTGLVFVVSLALLLISVVVTFTSGWFLAAVTGVAATRDEVVSYTLFHWAILVLIEFLVTTFALDRILRDVEPAMAGQADLVPRLIGSTAPPRPETANPAPATGPLPAPSPAGPAPNAPPALLRLQGISLDVRDILAIAAEEHYLRIVTADRTRLLRGRMVDVEAQMPPGLGMRVHRSHWVARRAVAGLNRAATGWTLLLVCGREVPVARGRQTAVRAWVEGPGD